MNTYFLKFRGTSKVYSVMSDTLHNAKCKFVRWSGAWNLDSIGYVQQVFKCNYQDMQSEIIK